MRVPLTKAVVVKMPAGDSDKSSKPAPSRRGGKPARTVMVKTPASGSNGDPKPAPKRKGKQPAKAATKRRRMSSVAVD